MERSVELAINFERERQIQQWGGCEHDDTHKPEEWLSFIAKQVKKAEREAKASDGQIDRATRFEVRDRLVKIAALAVAAIESMDRAEVA